jgi:hypothetical protein
MANVPGVYQLSDLLAVRNASAASFGLNDIWATIQAELAYVNQRTSEMLADLCQPFTEQSAVWGGGGTILMEEMDEFGHPLPSLSSPGIVAQFPIKMYKQRLGWNKQYFQTATPNEVASKFIELRKGYYAALTKGMRRALYGYGNGVTSEYSFTDHLTNEVALTVKSLCNGGVTVGTIPDSPAGAAFANTHCHLNFDDTVDASAYQDVIDHVVEHGNTAGLKCYIARANLAELATLTTIFKPLDSALITYMAANSTNQRMNWSDYENMEVGFLSGDIPVYVKPWAVAEYIVVAATGMKEKVLGYRQPANTAMQGWRIVAPYDDYPLYAENTEAIFGFAVFNRVMAAISQDAAGWTVPGPAV